MTNDQNVQLPKTTVTKSHDGRVTTAKTEHADGSVSVVQNATVIAPGEEVVGIVLDQI